MNKWASFLKVVSITIACVILPCVAWQVSWNHKKNIIVDGLSNDAAFVKFADEFIQYTSAINYPENESMVLKKMLDGYVPQSLYNASNTLERLLMVDDRSCVKIEKREHGIVNITYMYGPRWDIDRLFIRVRSSQCEDAKYFNAAEWGAGVVSDNVLYKKFDR